MLTFGVYLVALLLLIAVLCLVRIGYHCERNGNFLYSIQEAVNVIKEAKGAPGADMSNDLADIKSLLAARNDEDFIRRSKDMAYDIARL